MSEFIGFFVRDNLGQTPDQQGTSWSSSPDIIFQGTQSAPDPSQFLTSTGYATDYGSTVYVQNPPVQNFVYLRALNTNPAATSSNPLTARAWFYWVESDLVLWPQNWNTGSVQVAGVQQNYQDIVATANNQVIMPNLPYLWSPLPPASGQHYCCISWMEYPPSNPPQNPVLSFGYMGSWDALTQFVLQHHNMGWRNTADVAGQLTWSNTSNISGPEQPGNFWVGVQCSNMPTDGQLGYSIPGPNPSIPPIISNMGPITNPNMYNSVMIPNWPGGAKSSITVNYKQGATPPPPGSNVTVTVMVPTTSMSADTELLAWRKGLIRRLDHTMVAEFQRDSFVELAASTSVAVIGSQSYKF